MGEETTKTSARHLKLGECLVQAGLIDEKTLGQALQLQKEQKKRIGQILIEMGATDDEAIAKALAKQLGIPFVRLARVEIPREVLSLVPPEMCENYLLIPVKEGQGNLVVAMANPLEVYAVDDLRFVTHRSVYTVVSPQKDILDALNRHYPRRDIERDMATGPGIDQGLQVVERSVKEEVADIKELMKQTELPPIVRFTNVILADAVRLKASDIHIEPQKTNVIIRYRVDGIMREIMQVERRIHNAVVSRIKVISNMDIAERRKPQDGRSQIRYGEHFYDLRVSTIPTAYGEKVTIRILDQTRATLGFKDLGLVDKPLKEFESCITRPQGIILVTGPTGSGKSSTLYASLQKLNSPSVNIITVEDPVEYEVPGINQVQINPVAGITFASGLRSILRQDPDIVMVGEIRDAETASISLQAAQTGHLVFSTLHTNDAPSAVVRLMDLGVPSYLIASALTAVVGQRLVRKICDKCRAPARVSPEIMERLPFRVPPGKRATFYEGKGCEHCQYSGYAGRVGIYEIMVVGPTIREAILPGVSSSILKRAAQKAGFEGMLIDGIKKALRGMTSLEEVFRAVPPDPEEKIFASPIVASAGAGEAEAQGGGHQQDIMRAVSPIASKKVLLADENDMALRIFRNILESEGYHVIATHDGVEAMKLALQEKPDLVLYDAATPNLDGITLLQRLKAQLTTRYIPVILLAAEQEVDAEVRAMEAGAVDYLIKPVDPKRFLARVNRVLKRGQVSGGV